jgi:PAS domain S-box-containing protein
MRTISTAIKIVALLCYLILALLTLRSAANKRLRIFFSIYIFGMLSWQVTSLVINFAVEARTALSMYNIMIASSGAFSILFFPFTRALLEIKGQKVLTAAAYAFCLVQFTLAILGLQLKEVEMGLSGYWVPVYGGGSMTALSALSFAFWGLGFFNLLRGLYREKSPVRRNRIIYILIGAAVTIVGASTNLTPLRDYPVDISANLVSAAIIGYAVVRHRLMDIRLILARSLVYSFLTASLIAAYLGLIMGVESLLKSGVGYTNSAFGAVAVLMLAMLFMPLRNLLQSALDRLFFREKGDYQKATQAFSRAIASLYDEEPILDLVALIISRNLRTTFLSIALPDPRRETYIPRKSIGKALPSAADLGIPTLSPLARWLRKEGKVLVRDEVRTDPATRDLAPDELTAFETGAAAIAAPILLKDRLLGILVLGQKLAGTMFNAEDLSFLATITDQAATALDRSEIFLGIRRRLSEQTLLFILSEKIRGSVDLDSAMESIVLVLRNFLDCDRCALLYFDAARGARIWAQDRVSAAAAAVAAGAFAMRSGDPSRDDSAFAGEVAKGLLAREGLSEEERRDAASLRIDRLSDGDSTLGFLVITDRIGSGLRDEGKEELLRTIRAIISQGVVLHRTIANLSSVESYNEKILNSLNDMGDTLLILDFEGRIERANLAACKVLESSENALVGRDIGEIVSAVGDSLSGEDFLDLLRAGPVSNREVVYRGLSGALIPMLFSGSALPAEEGGKRQIIVIARDMTERRRAEESAKNLLLVHEIHHRIKNNLQVISSLLALQSGYITEERVREMFKDSQNRVRSMALIHEKVDLCAEIPGITLGMDAAVPCGLIINELVSNALKHAFPGDRTGRITVRMERIGAACGDGTGSEYLLTVADDGAGLPEGFDLKTQNSLGLKIVGTLARQLHGEVEMRRDGGTKFLIRFREA